MTTPTIEGGESVPLSQDWTLGNGQTARFEMPDMLKFADGSFDIPNAAQADVYELIYGASSGASPMAQLQFNRQKLKGLYALFAIVCVSPKLQLDPEERQPGELIPRQLTWMDLTAAYNFFQYGPLPGLSAAQNQEPGSGTEAPHSGRDLPPEA